MRPSCFNLPVSFRGPVGQLSCAAQAASQPSRAKIRKLLYHRFQSGGFLLVMYNRRDRRVIPSRNSRGTCLFLTCAGEILQLPPPTILDAYFRFLTTPGVRRGKNAFSPPHIGVIALSSAGTITGGTLFHGQGNRQSRHHHPEPHKIFHSPSYKYYNLDT